MPNNGIFHLLKYSGLAVLSICTTTLSAQILCDGSGYKITSSNPTPIYIIDPSSASPTATEFINSVNIKTTAFAYSLTHGLFFAVDSSDSQKLKTIDENGNTSLVSVTGLPNGTALGNVVMDVSYDGLLYVRRRNSSTNKDVKDELVKLSLAASGTSATYVSTLALPNNPGSDIAIHPTNSNIYSMDKGNIYVFNRNTGALVNTYTSGIGNFAGGSQFFDGEGRLYAWSNDQTGVYQNALVRYTFNSSTSVTEDNLGNTGIRGTGDGGGCPASINFLKGVSATSAIPGGTVDYTFTIENGYQDVVVFALEDTLPAGFTIQGNPVFTGDITGSQSVTVGTGDPQTLDITGITIPGSTAAPEGMKTGNITISVKIPNPYTGGTMTNQAKITGFPGVFGSEITSDKDDVSPSEPTPIVVASSPKLTLVKSVTNDDGGTATATEWTLSATGLANTLSGTSGSSSITAVLLDSPDTLALAEVGGPGGYNYTTLACVNKNVSGTNVSGVSKASPNLTLTYDDDVTCTFTNDDQASSADISVVKTLTSTGPYTSGQTVTYTITVSNAGPDTATNVVVTDLPTNLTINSVSSTNCSDLPCTIPSLANGASETITVQATAP